MRRVTDLITQVRRATDNEDYSATQGIHQEEFVQYLNDAQDRLQSLISAEYPNVFTAETTGNTVVGQEGYTVSDHVFLNNRIIAVEYSSTGASTDYYELEQRTIKERVTESGDPNFYWRRGGTLYFNPIATTATPTYRIVYERTLDDIDIRRAIVSGITGAGTAASPLTAIALANASPATDSKITDMGIGDYVCVCDKDGGVQVYNIPVTSAIATAITVPNHVFDTGEAIVAGDYITAGKYSTTHSDLPDLCERYLISYASWKMYRRDESEESANAWRELQELERDIVGAFGDVDKDLMRIPVVDPWMV